MCLRKREGGYGEKTYLMSEFLVKPLLHFMRHNCKAKNDIDMKPGPVIKHRKCDFKKPYSDLCHNSNLQLSKK